MSAVENPPAQDATSQKRMLRTAVLAARDSLAPTARAAGAARCRDAVLACDAFRQARCVLLYFSFGSEVETRGLLSDAWRDGKRVAAPRIDTARRLVLHEVTPQTVLQPQTWGIEAPPPGAPEITLQEIDFALVPGVAFDRHGTRLGYGSGYYDRLLAAAPAALPRVAIAFDAQVVDALPREAHDQPLHVLITPTHIFDFRKEHQP